MINEPVSSTADPRVAAPSAQPALRDHRILTSKLHPDGSPNTAPGLLDVLSKRLGQHVTGDDLFAYIAGVAGHPGYVELFDDELHTPGVRIPVTSDPVKWKQTVTYGRHVLWLYTYGEAGAHPAGYTDVRDPRIPITHPTYAVSIGTAMPTDYRYDEQTRSLHVGPGRWDDVPPDAAVYTVGGTNVLNSWLDYRLAAPRKRINSPLDRINAVQWDPAWSTELTNLLSVLTQLVELTDDMSNLLANITAGPVLTRNELAADAVVWPSSDKDRLPRATAQHLPARCWT
jgi:hypothetical protein